MKSAIQYVRTRYTPAQVSDQEIIRAYRRELRVFRASAYTRQNVLSYLVFNNLIQA